MDDVTRRQAFLTTATAGVVAASVAALGSNANAQQEKTEKQQGGRGNQQGDQDRNAGFRFAGEKGYVNRLGEANFAAAGNVGVATYNPVIYTGTAGGGPHEFAASNNPNVPNTHNVTSGFGLPSGARIIAAWYTSTHNIGDMSAFALIATGPSGSGVQLQVAGYPGRQARMRITIYVMFA